MNTLQHDKAIVTFEERILWIKFNNGIDIEISDLKEIYSFAAEKSNGKSYCVLYDTSGTFNLKEEVVEYVANNSGNEPIMAKAYIVNSEDHKAKARLHLVFDQPKIKPNIFGSKKEAVTWLQTFLQ